MSQREDKAKNQKLREQEEVIIWATDPRQSFLMTPKRHGHDDWEREFKKSSRGKNVIKQIIFASEKNPNVKVGKLIIRILMLCFFADVYDLKKDPMAIQYEKEKEAWGELKGAIKALEKLIRFNKLETWASIKGEIRLGQAFIDKERGIKSGPSPRLIKADWEFFLKAYRGGLKESFDNPPKYTQESRRFIAGLMFPTLNPQNLAGKKFIPSKNLKRDSFIFHLAYIFRDFTFGKFVTREPGAPMPKFGTPCYPQIAKISHAFFGEFFADDKVRKIVDRLVKARVTRHEWRLPESPNRKLKKK